MSAYNDEVCEDILNGGHDATLEELASAIRARQKALALLRGSSMRVGRLVRFNDRVSPKYLAGTEARIAENNGRHRVTVTLLNDAGRFRAGRPVKCSVEVLDVIYEEAA